METAPATPAIGPSTIIRRRPTTRKAPVPEIKVPERGSTGPTPIGEIMEPVNQIINHPDRDQLMADFFNRYW